jgi:surfeit locus 1 family protein
VFVNRGFVPQEMAADRAGLEPENAGEPTEVAGVARRAELAGSFTPASDGPNRIDWVRDPERLAALAEVEAPVAPLYVDLPAGPPGELPQGGGTVVSFSNNHLGYALTWFGFAILTPILLAFWVRRQRRPTRS